MLRLRDVLRAAVAHGENHEDLRLHYALPMRPQQLSAAHSEKIRISPEDRVDRTREQLRTVPRIGVGKTEYFTAYMAGADEKCPLLAEPTIGQRLRSNHAHTRIIGGETSCYLTRPIGGSIVHDQDLERRVGALEHGAHAGFDVPCFVPGGDYDAYTRRVCRKPGGFLIETGSMEKSPEQKHRKQDPH